MLDESAEEPRGCASIAPLLYEDVNHVTVLVYRTPEVVQPALNLHEDFVEMPRVTEPALLSLELPCVAGGTVKLS